MSLNDLLPLLLLAAFVLNIVVRARRQRQRGGSEPTRPGRPTSRPGERPAPRPEAGPDPAHGSAERTAGGSASTAQGDRPTNVLEEARRRVREAMAEESGDAPPARRAPSAEASPGGRQAAPVSGRQGQQRPSGAAGPSPQRPHAAPPQGFLGREGQSGSAPGQQRSQEPGRETIASRMKGESTVPVVERRGARKGSARLRAAEGLGRDRRDVVRGFVWSLVLGEPSSRRFRPRRKVSPRR
ncbi:MAG: hypothetical protein U5K81_08015 [Trueperaceae bacterium]|nr:hypothetical protein [Trueperaceae bacterium]